MKKVCIALFVLLTLVFSMNVSFAAEPVGYDDLTVLGVPYNAKKVDIIDSLGTPTKEGPRKGMDISYYVAYGGVSFNLTTRNDNGSIVSIVIKNRDALTERNIGVGDPASKIFNAYGTSYRVNTSSNGREYRYFWGRPNTDDAHGVAFFCNNNNIVYQIVIYT